jgi:hypothetical protein
MLTDHMFWAVNMAAAMLLAAILLCVDEMSWATLAAMLTESCIYRGTRLLVRVLCCAAPHEASTCAHFFSPSART